MAISETHDGRTETHRLSFGTSSGPRAQRDNNLAVLGNECRLQVLFELP